MATLKILNGTYRTLEGMIQYIADDAGHDNGVLFYSARGADPYRAARDMLNVQAAYNNLGGNEYVQVILSLAEDEISSREDTMRFQQAVKDISHLLFSQYQCQVAYVIHGNTDNLHAHFIINSVRYVDGYKLQIGKGELYRLKASVSDILDRYVFSRILGWLYNEK